MTMRIGHTVVEGLIDCTRPGEVTGWIRLQGRNEALWLDLDGDAAPDLDGGCYRLVRISEDPDSADDCGWLRREQFGKVGHFTADETRFEFPCTMEEFVTRAHAGERPEMDRKPAVFLEWWGPDGRVVIESTRLALEPSDLREWTATAREGIPV
jgi:hypothetical protein